VVHQIAPGISLTRISPQVKLLVTATAIACGMAERALRLLRDRGKAPTDRTSTGRSADGTTVTSKVARFRLVISMPAGDRDRSGRRRIAASRVSWRHRIVSVGAQDAQNCHRAAAALMVATEQSDGAGKHREDRIGQIAHEQDGREDENRDLALRNSETAGMARVSALPF
jgi:hypothetical protein